MAQTHNAYVAHVDTEDESKGMVARCDCGWEGESGDPDEALADAQDHVGG